ncbi:hypothetical protein ACW2AQ_05485 [Nitrosomonas europaea]
MTRAGCKKIFEDKVSGTSQGRPQTQDDRQ